MRKSILKDAFLYGKMAEAKRSFARFVPGQTPIPASGKIVGGKEVAAAVSAALDMHFTEGHLTDKFEAKIAKRLGVRYASLVNSGSSANLLAVSAMTSYLRERPWQPSDEIITVAAGFPTTLNPIIQNGLTPVFVDVELDTLVPRIDMIEKAITKKTRGIFMAHTLGNPLPLDGIIELCKKHDLILLEDNCDALGSLYRDKLTGTFGLMSTLSMYPAHHITAGEGGVVFTNSPTTRKIVESFRDWGRECWCVPGEENTCGKRYEHKYTKLPSGYDHKYVYSHIGYNLKSTDFQASIALVQLGRLADFISIRRSNHAYLYEKLKDLQDVFILPKATPNSVPSWFGFALTVRPDSFLPRKGLLEYLGKYKIGTRLLFGGDLLQQPAYHGLALQYDDFHLPNTFQIAHGTFWVGVWPGITETMLDFIAKKIRDYVTK